MFKKANIFTKIVVLIIGMLILLMALFAYYNHSTVRVIHREIESANLNKLMFLKSQLEEKFNRISTNAIMLSNDPVIRELEYADYTGNWYERQKLLKMILGHISLQADVTGWHADITVYSRVTKETISTSSMTWGVDEERFIGDVRRGWQYAAQGIVDGADDPQFVWYAVTPATVYENPKLARLVLRTSFSASHLQDMLDQYKLEGQGDPFLYDPHHGVIANRTLRTEHARKVIQYLNQQRMEEDRTNLSVHLQDEEYLVNYLRLNGPGWYLVDYVPMKEVLAPVTRSSNMLYAVACLLLVFGVIASYYLYRNLQVPIQELVRHVRRIERGDYSSRISMKGGSEFSFLFFRFNEMAETVQNLLERVYEEQIRSREAMLKQLQSQINPHFLYNCLFYIKNMARLGDEESVVAMALNLGEYFRYTTRMNKETALFQEELDVVVNYLEIQNLRMKRIAYQIEVPEPIRMLVIPRLMLQPIVENAVIHGIEPIDGKGEIRIRGEVHEGEYRVVVEDNGVGLDDDQLSQLQIRLELPEEEVSASYGLWNVNQRLKLMFAPGSGLLVSRSPLGGLAVTVVMKLEKEESRRVSDSDRG
jgi:Predicted signal transduction protein with a C-terminal ATPase domain